MSSLDYELGTFAAPSTGFVAFCTGIVVVVLAGIGLLTAGETEPASGESFLGPFWGKALITLLSLVGYAVLLNVLGFVICTFLFILILHTTMEGGHWRAAGLWAAAAAVACHLVFQTWLKAQLPAGLLGSFF